LDRILELYYEMIVNVRGIGGSEIEKSHFEV
jgi:hypothetical protein